MRRAFFFIVAIVFATSSFASIPRASLLDRASEDASTLVAPLSETRIRVSDVLVPSEQPAPNLLNRALHQAYADVSTTNASGLAGFLSVDPTWERADLSSPQSWNRYSYVLNNPLRYTDPDGRLTKDDFKQGVGILLLLAGANESPIVPPGRDTPLKKYLRESLESVTPEQKLALTMTSVRSPEKQTLHHFGTQKKTAETLAKKAAEAEENIGVHGVSTTTAKPNKPHTTAERAEVERHFEVKQTGADPNHHTVVLPKPVTEKIADLFNRLFNRK